MRALVALEDLSPLLPREESEPLGRTRRVLNAIFYEAVLAGTCACLIGEAVFGGPARFAILVMLSLFCVPFMFATYRRAAVAWAEGNRRRGLILTALSLAVSVVLCSIAALNAGFSNTCLGQASCTDTLALPFVAFSVATILFALAGLVGVVLAPMLELTAATRAR